ncbi:MAG: phage head-tail connector protein [Kordiimonadaceae bacterium]|nr:phage head-tail connector protein [Kordiimonadaceae bacterium]
MRTEIVTKPLSEPVLLEEFKDHLKLDGSEEDSSLGALITAARTHIEDYLDLALIDRTVDYFMDAWPTEQTFRNSGGAYEPWWSGVADGSLAALSSARLFAPISIRPARQVDSISVFAADGSEVVWGADNYYLKPGLYPGITRRNGRRWPVPGRFMDGIKVRLTVGFGPDWNDVPASIRQAVLMLAAHMYSYRGEKNMDAGMKASGVMSLLRPFREKRL